MSEYSSPIFIHSLFRSGSTYIFNVFRRNLDIYTCYQEPLNEFLLAAKYEPELLLKEQGSSLRHPNLDKPYYYEFYLAKEKVGEFFKKNFSYDDFFSVENVLERDIKKYFSSLIEVNDGKRKVLQCCRSFGRIDALKKELGGIHIYLARHPWDQWWSYKVEEYFDVANMQILNAQNLPELLQIVKQELKFEGYHDDKIQYEINHFSHRKLKASQSYMLFYSLWCIGALKGSGNCNYLINMNLLSSDEAYRDEIKKGLAGEGIAGVSFDDCNLPCNVYSGEEKIFFETIENHVHELMKMSGYSESDIRQIQQLREKLKSTSEQKGDAAQFRRVAMRYLDEVFELQSGLQQKQRLEAEEKLELVMHKLEVCTEEKMRFKSHLDSILISFSWKITKPLRDIKKYLFRNV